MLNILTVCTGNICRSPLAAQVLSARLLPLGVHVSSAGTRAPAGRPMTPEARSLAAARGVGDDESGQHRSRLLTSDLLRSADLILAMSREHRRAIVEMEPAQLRRVFTIREFARLTEGVPDEEFTRLRASAPTEGDDERYRPFDDVLAAVAARRGFVEAPANASDDDVIDPYLQPIDVYERCGEELGPAIDAVERVVRLAHRGR
uniref:arsenate reductase/protein-tyrosine-phosphatase family protein n=1 Tax=Microbacterium sp. SORGH_AS_1204 TaxID=3041785 RepID=UPI0027D7A2D5|nr:low molecular weight phosphatase family protein [Microbacterium sp. SORGH_AS_1204]